MQLRDVIILGGGPAGLAAAIYAGRAGLDTVLLEKGQLGGQIAQTSEVENYPGFPELISGPELVERMVNQAKKFGAEVELDEVLSVDSSHFQANSELLVKGYEADYRTRAIIVASGANPKKLGIPGEDRFWGRGVSTCATCDGFFYRDRQVVVAGGGDAAVEEGLFLTKFASQVTLVHRRDQLRANRVAQERAMANPKMRFVWNSEVTEVLGSDTVTGVRLRNRVSGELSELAADGFFVFIGHEPNTGYLGDLVQLDAHGYVAVHDQVRTSHPAVFSAGDVSDPVYRQLATSTGSGAQAAMIAERYLAQVPERQLG